MSMAVAEPRVSTQIRRVPMDRPARVLHVVPELASGGMERAMLRLVQRSHLYDQQLVGGSGIAHGICILNEAMPELAEQCPSTVPTWVLRSNQKRRLRAWRAFSSVIHEFKPDVVHARSTGIWFDAATAVMRKNARLLLSFHGKTQLESPSRRRRAVLRWAAQRANKVMTVSHEAAEMLYREWSVPIDKLVTILNGVDTSTFYPADGNVEIQSIRQQLQLPPGANVAVCVANLLPIKRLDILIRAWRRIVMADPLARLLIIGQGPLCNELVAMTEHQRCTQYIRFLGNREDVADILRASDLFVLPSEYESCSNATLEAMASGLPVVGYDVGGMRELVVHNRTGWLAQPNNDEALGNAILAALMDRNARRRAGAAGRDLAIKQFGIDTWVAKYTSLYRGLAGLRPPQLIRREGAAECAE